MLLSNRLRPRRCPPTQQQPLLLDGVVAVVGDQTITLIDLRERALSRIQRGEVPKPATDSAARVIELETLDDMIQEELLIQKAADLKVEVADADVSQMVDRQVRDVRSKYTTESEYRTALTQAGLGTPEEYRKYMLDQYKRRFLLERIVAQTQTGRQDRSGAGDQRRSGGRVRPLQGVSAAEAADRDVQADRHRRAAHGCGEGSRARSGRVASRAAQGGRGFRANGEARVDGPAHQGNGRRSRLGSSR